MSHVVWDRIAVGPLDLASSLLGGVICFWLLHRLARRHSSTYPATHPHSGTIPGSRLPAESTSSSASVRSPGGPADGLGRRPIVFWGMFAAVLISGGALLPSLPGYFLPHTMSARIILLAVGAVVIAAAATSGVTAAVTRLGVSRSRGKPRQQ